MIIYMPVFDKSRQKNPAAEGKTKISPYHSSEAKKPLQQNGLVIKSVNHYTKMKKQWIPSVSIPSLRHFWNRHDWQALRRFLVIMHAPLAGHRYLMLPVEKKFKFNMKLKSSLIMLYWLSRALAFNFAYKNSNSIRNGVLIKENNMHNTDNVLQLLPVHL